jgi:hypothetical protein
MLAYIAYHNEDKAHPSPHFPHPCG